MKKFMLTGTIIGFLLGIGLGIAGRTDWPSIFLHAAAAAAALGLLMRWWAGVWLRGLRASCEQRQQAEAVARQQAHSTSAQKK
jgi:galactitol-specific phosphotransferase system IIC component